MCHVRYICIKIVISWWKSVVHLCYICLYMASKQEIFLPFDEKTLYCNTHLKYFWPFHLIVGTVGCLFVFWFFFLEFPPEPWSCLLHYNPHYGAPRSSQRASRSNFSKRLLLPMQTIAHLQADVKLTAEVLEKRFIFEQYFTFFDFKQNNWG